MKRLFPVRRDGSSVWVRLLDRAKKDGKCLRWISNKSHNGYGMFSFKGKTQGAHRFSYEYHHGSIDTDLEIDHICRVRDCINPKHLRAVSRIENMFNSETHKAVMTHCSRGHLLVKREDGYRFCKPCKLVYDRKWYSKNREKVCQEKREQYALKLEKGKK